MISFAIKQKLIEWATPPFANTPTFLLIGQHDSQQTEVAVRRQYSLLSMFVLFIQYCRVYRLGNALSYAAAIRETSTFHQEDAATFISADENRMAQSVCFNWKIRGQWPGVEPSVFREGAPIQSCSPQNSQVWNCAQVLKIYTRTRRGPLSVFIWLATVESLYGTHRSIWPTNTSEAAPFRIAPTGISSTSVMTTSTLDMCPFTRVLSFYSTIYAIDIVLVPTIIPLEMLLRSSLAFGK